MISIELIDSPRSQSEKPFDRLQGPGSNLSGMGELRNIEILLHRHHQERLENSRLILQQNGRESRDEHFDDQRGWLRRAWCLLSSSFSRPAFDR